MVRQAASRGEADLERPDDPLCVAGADAPGGGGVDAPQHPVQENEAAPVPDPFQPSPQLGLSPRSVEHPPQQTADIQSGSSHEKRPGLALPALGEGPVGRTDIVAGGEITPGIGDVDQAVGHRGPFLDRRLGRSAIETPIDLHGIRAQDRPSVIPGQGDGEGALANRRRSDDHNQWLFSTHGQAQYARTTSQDRSTLATTSHPLR